MHQNTHNATGPVTYTAVVNQTLINKLFDSCGSGRQGGFVANKTVADAFGIPYADTTESYLARKKVFTEGKFFIKDLQYPHMTINVTPSHNRGTLNLSYIYDNRVGQTKEGKRYVRVIGTYPGGKFPKKLWDDVTALYKEIDDSFFRGDDWFLKRHQTTDDKATLSSHFGQFESAMERLVRLGELDQQTLYGYRLYWKHLSKMPLWAVKTNAHSGKVEYEKTTSQFINQPLKSITRKDILILKELMPEWLEKSPASTNNLLNMLARYMRYAEDLHWIDTYPFERVSRYKLKSRDRTLSYEELAKFFDYLLFKDTRANERVKILLVLYWIISHRKTEVLSLKWSDISESVYVDEVTGQKYDFIFISNKKGLRRLDKEGSNWYPVYLSPMQKKLFDQIAKHPHNPYIFWSESKKKGHTHITESVINRTVDRICKAMKMRRFTPHDIKRSNVTNDNYKFGREAVKLLTGNKSDRVLEESYIKKGNLAERTVAPELARAQIELAEKRDALIQQKMKEADGHGKGIFDKAIYDNTTRKHKLDQQKRYNIKRRERIKKEYGMSEPEYYRRGLNKIRKEETNEEEEGNKH